MVDLGELYQQTILDHNRNPRNFRRLETANRTAEGRFVSLRLVSIPSTGPLRILSWASTLSNGSRVNRGSNEVSSQLI